MIQLAVTGGLQEGTSGGKQQYNEYTAAGRVSTQKNWVRIAVRQETPCWNVVSYV